MSRSLLTSMGGPTFPPRARCAGADHDLSTPRESPDAIPARGTWASCSSSYNLIRRA
jgi:hypothetical protein